MRKKSRLKRENKTSSEPMKMSEMVMQFAADYIKTGDALEERQSYLNSACTAWNIAILDERTRPVVLEKYLKQYQAINPGVTDTDVENLRQNMHLLIEEKLKLFPLVKKTIVDAELKDIDGKQVVTVTSMKLPSHLNP
jgi:hypothetical protein